MPEMLLTFYCATPDRDVIVDRIRPVTAAPLHLREERVLGRDFGDAHASEQVHGALKRTAIDLVVEEGALDTVIDAVDGARRRHPVRWQATPILRRGRLA